MKHFEVEISYTMTITVDRSPFKSKALDRALEKVHDEAESLKINVEELE